MYTRFVNFAGKRCKCTFHGSFANFYKDVNGHFVGKKMLMYCSVALRGRSRNIEGTPRIKKKQTLRIIEEHR